MQLTVVMSGLMLLISTAIGLIQANNPKYLNVSDWVKYIWIGSLIIFFFSGMILGFREIVL